MSVCLAFWQQNLLVVVGGLRKITDTSISFNCIVLSLGGPVVAHFIRNHEMPVRCEFQPYRRLPFYPWARSYPCCSVLVGSRNRFSWTKVNQYKLTWWAFWQNGICNIYVTVCASLFLADKQYGQSIKFYDESTPRCMDDKVPSEFHASCFSGMPLCTTAAFVLLHPFLCTFL